MLPLIDSTSPRVPVFSFAFLETLPLSLAPTLEAYRRGGRTIQRCEKKCQGDEAKSIEEFDAMGLEVVCRPEIG